MENKRTAVALPEEKRALKTLLSSPEAYCRALRCRDLDDVFAAPNLTLGMINRHTGIVGARAVLSLLLAEVVEFFNVGKTMNDTQVALTCDLIIERFPYFKPEDFKLCFRQAMTGRYGQLFDRLDGAVIFDWLNRYSLQRDEAAIADEMSRARRSTLDNGILYQDYLVSLRERAGAGDPDARQALEMHLNTRELLKRMRRKR